MCLAVPFQIKEINGTEAVADKAGIERKIRLDFIKDPAPGDFVLVHAGFAIEKLLPSQARESLDAASELAAELQKIAEDIETRRSR